MKIQDLCIKLKKAGIPEERYYLQGLCGSFNDDDKFSLVVKKGTHSTEYETYFKERGEKHSIRIFSNEDEACQYFYTRLTENKIIEDKFST